jgi:uncharacterized protein YcbX
VPAQVTAIYRYPVKGLSAEALSRIAVMPGAPLPLDRAWAIENGPGRFDAASPRHVPKTSFLMLMRNERLATLESKLDEATSTLTILRGGKTVASGDLSIPAGRQIIEQFMAAYMADGLRGAPKVVSAEDHPCADSSEPYLHIVNLATVRAIEREVGRPVDPLRFRPNVIIDDVEPWAEAGWVGREIALGSVRLAVRERTDRCAATNVDPATGARDMDIPALLMRRWQHVAVGIYAEVIAGGDLAVGDAVVPPAAGKT